MFYSTILKLNLIAIVVSWDNDRDQIIVDDKTDNDHGLRFAPSRNHFFDTVRLQNDKVAEQNRLVYDDQRFISDFFANDTTTNNFKKPIENDVRQNGNGKDVLETQHATCQVTTEELVATAQATVTRVLKGLCNAKEIEEKFQNLENQLAEQLSVIKLMILNMEDRLVDQEENIKIGQRKLFGSLTRHCSGLAPAATAPVKSKLGETIRSPQPLQEDSQKVISSSFADEDQTIEDLIADGPRESEILTYNSSIHNEPGINGGSRKVFTYYWRVRHMEYKLTGWNHRRSLRSQSFYIFASGYRMYLRIYPRQNEENFFIHVGITKGEFDENLKWPFTLKHKVNILDQTKNSKMFEDISSRIWDPKLLCSEFNWQKPLRGDNYECVGLGFPNDVLRQREYIRGDSVVIKLTVYLDN